MGANMSGLRSRRLGMRGRTSLQFNWWEIPIKFTRYFKNLRLIYPRSYRGVWLEYGYY